MKKMSLIFLLAISLNLSAQVSLPSISLKSLSGEMVNVQEKTNEGLYLVSFWASWCVSCINELDEISDVYDEWQEDLKVELIAISIDDSRTKARVKPMVNGKGWEFEVLLDTNQELKRRMNVNSVPYIMIIKDGKVVYSHSGYTPGQEDEIYELLKQYSK